MEDDAEISYIQSDTDLLKRSMELENLVNSEPTLTCQRKVCFHPFFETETILEDALRGDSQTELHKQAKSATTSLKSAMEIRNQHYEKQKQYAARKNRSKNITGIDFEGILNLIGGCSKWQLLIYLFISTQQVPHAMYNLSVVYMMYQPDHWCRIPYFNRESFSENATTDYSWNNVLNSNVAYPTKMNKRRNGEWHSQCEYYNRDYVHLKSLKWEQVHNISTDVPIMHCTQWDYDKSVMKKTVVTEWNTVCDNNWSRAHVHMSYSLGYLVGCFLGGMVSDRFGRKTAIYGFSILSAIFGFLMIYAKEFEIFLITRFLLAASNEAMDLAAYVLCMEVTGVKYRSIVGSLMMVPWACGYSLLAFVAYLTRSWVDIQWVTLILHVISIVPVHFLPESPRWLIMANRVPEAEEIIREACQMNKRALPCDLELVRHAERRKQRTQPSILTLFSTKELRLRYTILLVIWVATALVYYGLVLTFSVPLPFTKKQNQDDFFFLKNAIAGIIEIPTLLCCVFMLKYGRKRSQMITLICAGLFNLMAIVSISQELEIFSLICMLFGKVFIQGAFNIMYIFTSELSPTIVRNRVVGMSSMMGRMGAGASGYIAILSDITQPTVPILIFAFFALFAGVLVMFLPETQDLPLPDTILDAVMMKNRPQTCTGSSEMDSEASDEERADKENTPVQRKNSGTQTSETKL